MGCFITIEGVEGSGKSTLTSKLATELKAQCPDIPEVVVTREPGATSIGKQIRKLLLDEQNHEIVPQAELFLFAADRAQHVEQILRPALARDALVLCDRYIHSTFAYQGHGRGLNLGMLESLMELATGGLHPDLVVLLDLPPEIGLERVRARAAANAGGADWTRFEADAIEFHRRIRGGFLELAAQKPEYFVRIDATLPTEEVFSCAFERIRAAWKKRK